MPGFIHYDLDKIEQRIAWYNNSEVGSDRRRTIADNIVENILMNELLAELRCLRERVLSPCPDPLGHTHARDNDAL